MLQLRNITKTYKVGNGQVVALDNVSIDFPDKGIVFVVGKSGSGKSTLLNILGGLDKMDSGEIIIDGHLKHTWWYDMLYTDPTDLTPQREEDISKAAWVAKSSLPPFLLNTYPSIMEVFREAKV